MQDVIDRIQVRPEVRTVSARRTPHRERGFTLLEIMVVVVILGILGALIVPQMFGQVEKARVSKAHQDLKTIEAALDMYRLDNFRFPSTDQGLKALVEKPADSSARNWKPGGYLKDLEKDPWGNDYLYVYPGTHGKEMDLYTYGADGQEGGEENDTDIANWDPKK